MIAVLVASADDRRDIFDTCFAHSDRIWAACPWPRYVGLNTPGPDLYGFKVIAAPPRPWCAQVAAYIDALPQEIDRILLMVEDTLFLEPVDIARVPEIHASYLRLVPLRRNWFARYFDGTESPRLIPDNEPYYSATEMAIWERQYLRLMLTLPNDAWSFEHIVTSKEHFAVREPAFNQHQIVSRGRWSLDAPRLLAQVGLSIKGDRPFQTAASRWRGIAQNVNFALFGFTLFRIRRTINEVSSVWHHT